MDTQFARCALLGAEDFAAENWQETASYLRANAQSRLALLAPEAVAAARERLTAAELAAVRVAIDAAFAAPVRVAGAPCRTLHEVFAALDWPQEGWDIPGAELCLGEGTAEAKLQTRKAFAEAMACLCLPLVLRDAGEARLLLLRERLLAAAEPFHNLLADALAKVRAGEKNFQSEAGKRAIACLAGALERQVQAKIETPLLVALAGAEKGQPALRQLLGELRSVAFTERAEEADCLLFLAEPETAAQAWAEFAAGRSDAVKMLLVDVPGTDAVFLTLAKVSEDLAVRGLADVAVLPMQLFLLADLADLLPVPAEPDREISSNFLADHLPAGAGEDLENCAWQTGAAAASLAARYQLPATQANLFRLTGALLLRRIVEEVRDAAAANALRDIAGGMENLRRGLAREIIRERFAAEAEKSRRASEALRARWEEFAAAAQGIFRKAGRQSQPQEVKAALFGRWQTADDGADELAVRVFEGVDADMGAADFAARAARLLREAPARETSAASLLANYTARLARLLSSVAAELNEKIATLSLGNATDGAVLRAPDLPPAGLPAETAVEDLAPLFLRAIQDSGAEVSLTAEFRQKDRTFARKRLFAPIVWSERLEDALRQAFRLAGLAEFRRGADALLAACRKAQENARAALARMKEDAASCQRMLEERQTRLAEEQGLCAADEATLCETARDLQPLLDSWQQLAADGAEEDERRADT